MVLMIVPVIITHKSGILRLSVAIKCADVGVAMGKNGSDVTKEVADVVLSGKLFMKTFAH